MVGTRVGNTVGDRVVGVMVGTRVGKTVGAWSQQ